MTRPCRTHWQRSRSVHPNRAWVRILRALQHLPDEPEQAAGLLARIGDGSAFRQLRRAAQLALLPEIAFLEAIAAAGKTSVRFACALRGWPQTRIALWEELDRLRGDPRPETLLRFMNRHREALGADWVHRRGLRLLLAGYPVNRKRLAALGAGPGPPTKEETLLLAAWDAERREDPWGEQAHWERYARHLIRAGAGEPPESEHTLRIALALRRCDRVAGILGHEELPPADPEALDTLGRRSAGREPDLGPGRPRHLSAPDRLLPARQAPQGYPSPVGAGLDALAQGHADPGSGPRRRH